LKVLSTYKVGCHGTSIPWIDVASGADLRAFMPQRGNGLQPRVAASATLGKRKRTCPQPQRGYVWFVHFFRRKRRNRVAVEISFLTSSQGSRGGNPGLEAVAPLGH